MNIQKKKYQVVTYHPTENGFDEKSEHNTLAEAKAECKEYLYKDNPGYKWYEEAYIITDTEVVMVFDEFHHNGRKPYSIEIAQFSFAKPQQAAAVQLSLNF